MWCFHRIVEGLQENLVQPQRSVDSEFRTGLFRALSGWVSKASEDGDFSSPSAWFSAQKRTLSSVVNLEHPPFPVATVSLLLLIVPLQKGPGSVFSVTSMQVGAGCCQVPQSHLFCRLGCPAPPAAPHRVHVPAPQVFWWLFAKPTEFYQHVSCAWGPRPNAVSRCALMSAKCTWWLRILLVVLGHGGTSQRCLEALGAMGGMAASCLPSSCPGAAEQPSET